MLIKYNKHTINLSTNAGIYPLYHMLLYQILLNVFRSNDLWQDFDKANGGECGICINGIENKRHD